MNKKSLVYIAVFGTLWGAVEAGLGTALHLLHLPFDGVLLSGIGLILIARVYNNTKGSTFLIALVAAIIKLMSFSAIKLGPFIGIIMVGILIEMVLSLLGTNKLSFIISGLVISLYPITQNIATKSILFGMDIIPLIFELADNFSENIGYEAGWWIIGLYFAIHCFIGLSSAFLALIIKNRVHKLLVNANQ